MSKNKHKGLKLRKFNMNMMKDDSFCVVIGKRGSGKSVLVSTICKNKKDFPLGTIISPTEEANPFYSSFFPKKLIHSDYSNDIIKEVIKRQRKVKKAMQKEIQQKGETTIDGRYMLIMDDCMYDKSWSNDKTIRNVVLNGRHYNIMYMVVLQYPLGIPPVLRGNIDWVFILRDNVTGNRKRLYENYAGMFPTFDMFCNVLDQTTENYECLVIHNGSNSNKLEDQIFWYKAEPDFNFKMCAEEVWAYNNHLIENEPESDDDDFDVDMYRKKKNPYVFVDKED